MKIRNLTVLALTVAMAVSPVLADNTSAVANGPLSAGKPAGTQQAALEGDTWKVVGALVLIGAVVFAASSSGGGKTSTTGTSS